MSKFVDKILKEAFEQNQEKDEVYDHNNPCPYSKLTKDMIIQGRKEFFNTVKGQKLHHATSMKNAKAIIAKGLTNDFNFFTRDTDLENELHTDFEEGETFVIELDADKFLNRLYPDMEAINSVNWPDDVPSGSGKSANEQFC